MELRVLRKLRLEGLPVPRVHIELFHSQIGYGLSWLLANSASVDRRSRRSFRVKMSKQCSTCRFSGDSHELLPCRQASHQDSLHPILLGSLAKMAHSSNHHPS